MSSLFKSKKEEIPAPREISTDLQKEARNRLKGMGAFGTTPVSYEDLFGDLPTYAADESYEAVIPELLTGFTQRKTPETTQAGIKQIMDTLTGAYDPTTSEYYKSTRRGIEKERQESQKNIRQAAQAAGQFRSTGRLGEEQKLEEETFATIADVMGRLTEAERQRKLDVVPQAMAAGQEEEAFPLRTLAALQEFSLFPRRQAALEAERSNIQAGRNEQLSIAQLLADPSSYQWYQPQYNTEASPFESILMPLIQSGAQVASAYAGGAGGSKSILDYLKTLNKG